MAGAVRVRNYRQVMRAFQKAGKSARPIVRKHLKTAGEPVRADAESRFSTIDPAVARGYRVVVRARGVAVEQRRGRTTGKHPDFGRLQMQRALVPAVDAKHDAVERELERALDAIADVFERS